MKKKARKPGLQKLDLDQRHSPIDLRRSGVLAVESLMVANSDDAEPVELNISPEKVCYIISRARMFDVKVEPVEPEPASTSIDAEDQDVLEDYPGDPTAAELREVIDDLNDDEVVDLIALAWVGRGDYSREEWVEARALALERHRQHSAGYLMGMPTLGDYLEEGVTALGYSCEES